MVLPCVPAIATACLRRISSASISARRTTGSSRSRAAFSSGLSRLDRRGDDDHLAHRRDCRRRGRWRRRCPCRAGAARWRCRHCRSPAPCSRDWQHLGDAAHADAADADEMHRADVARHLHACSPLLTSATVRLPRHASTRSARRSAASGLPADFARRGHRPLQAAPDRPSARPRSPASALGVSSVCSIIQPPPASASTCALAFWSWSSACGQRNQDRRPADDGELGDGRGAGRGRRRDALPAMRAGRSVKNGASSARRRARDRPSSTRSMSSGRHCCTIAADAACARPEAARSPPARDRRRSARPGCRRRRAGGTARRRRARG